MRKKDYHSNLGKPFEELINWLNKIYRGQRRAVIGKVPTPITLIGPPDKDGYYKAFPAEKSTVDYVGIYGGRGIGFEAKHTEGQAIRWDEVKLHQATYLNDLHMNGGIAFVFVSYKLLRMFVIPWEYWEQGTMKWRQGKGPASLNIKIIPPEWEMHHQDYLKVVDRLWPESQSA